MYFLVFIGYGNLSSIITNATTLENNAKKIFFCQKVLAHILITRVEVPKILIRLLRRSVDVVGVLAISDLVLLEILLMVLIFIRLIINICTVYVYIHINQILINLTYAYFFNCYLLCVNTFVFHNVFLILFPLFVNGKFYIRILPLVFYNVIG